MNDNVPRSVEELLQDEYGFKPNTEETPEPKEKKRRSAEAQDDIESSFYKNDEFIVEEIFNAELNPAIQFASYDLLKGTISYIPNISIGNRILKPIDSEMIRKQQILLPSHAENYINDSDLISEIELFIQTYLDLPHPFYLKLVSHYILNTWVYDRLSVVPYLRAVADAGSGKTRFAQVVGSLSYKPLFMAGATSDAFIFRLIELFKGTMILNELERVNTDLHSQLVIILNNGYEKGLYVGRVEGDRKKEPKMFDVFSPKIITSRQKFKDLALESRILNIPMRTTKRKDIPVVLDKTFWNQAEKLRNKLLMFRFRNLTVTPNTDLEELSKVEPRLRQTLLPIFSIVQDVDVRKEFVKYALDFQEQMFADRNLEVDSVIAETLLNLLDKNAKVTIKEIGDLVNQGVPEKEKLSPKAIGAKIRGFGFKTKRVQGVYQIIANSSIAEALRDRYGFNTQEISPQSPVSTPVASNSEGDLVDKGDIVYNATQVFFPLEQKEEDQSE